VFNCSIVQPAAIAVTNCKECPGCRLWPMTSNAKQSRGDGLKNVEGGEEKRNAAG